MTCTILYFYYGLGFFEATEIDMVNVPFLEQFLLQGMFSFQAFIILMMV